MSSEEGAYKELMKKEKFISYSLKAIKALATRNMILENDCIPIRIQNLSYRKIFNAIRVGMSFCTKSTKTWGWPISLQVEPSSMCNLRCVLCPVTEGMGRPTGNMDFALFKKTIDEIGDYVFLIILWDWGEPFVNLAVYDMIAYAKKRNISLISSTNAHVFAKEENAKKLVASGIDSIIVAIDGIKQDTYERFRQTGKLETALKGTRNLVAMKRALNSQTPLINFRFLATKHNEHEIPDLKKLAKSLGVDALTIKTVNPYESYSENRFDRQANFDEILPVNERYQRFAYEEVAGEHHRIRRNSPCKRLWDCMTIRWNGVIPICTYDYREMHVLGNIMTTSAKHIWYGDSMRSFRRQFGNNPELIDLCKSCSYSFVGGSCDGETIAEVFYNQSVENLFSRPENPEKVKPL